MSKIIQIVLLFMPFFGFSQKDTIAHLYTFGSLANDLGEDISATSDGGFIVVGSTASSGDGNTDVYLLKIDSLCNKEWSWALGGLNNDWGYAVKQTYDNGYIIAATSNSFGNGGYDAMLIKRDSFGNYEWQKTYGGNDWDFAYDVIQTFDSGYVFCGETYNNTNGYSDVYVVKTNSIGDTVWTRTVGGTLIDKGNALIQTSDSNIVVAGLKNTLSDSTQAYVLKFDKNGALLWDSVYGGARFERANDIVETQDGGFVFTGASTSFGPGDKDYYIVKVSSSGLKIWEQLFSNPLEEEGFSIYELLSGNFINVGYTNSYGGGKKDAHLFMITSGGWWGGKSSTFGGLEDEITNGFALGLNGSMYLSGYTNGYGEGLNDLMVIRVDTIVAQQQFTVTSTIDVAAIGLSEYKVNKTIFRVFPNPSTHYISIEFEEAPTHVTITNLMGSIVLSKSINQPTFKVDLDISSLSSGVYLLECRNNKDEKSVEKLIVLD